LWNVASADIEIKRERKEKIKEDSQSSTNHWKLLYMRRPVR
jgi:hypothetical protein